MAEAEIITNFCLIKYVPTKPNSNKIDLNTIFDAVISGTPLQVDNSQLSSICENDLHIDLTKLDKKLVKLVCEALIYYMSMWPGWERCNEYRSGKLQRDDWIEKYRKYLNLKGHFVIKSAMQYKQLKDTTEKVTQTESDTITNLSGKFASYTLVIGGPPQTLNNIVFKEHNGSILLKQHVGKDLDELKCQQILNWPHVSVTITLPDISITRKNTHAYNRYLDFKGDTIIFSEIDHVVHITKDVEVNEADMESFTYDYFLHYFVQLYSVFFKIPNMKSDRLEEIMTILKEFARDIKEINLYGMTMAKHVTVGYRIGNCRYVRNKKMTASKKDQAKYGQRSVNFYEVITPQVDISLLSFKAEQDLSSVGKITFQSLNALLNQINNQPLHPDLMSLHYFLNNECITFSCTFCNEDFGGSDACVDTVNHFREHHKSEIPVYCYKCGSQFEISELSENRWSHDCIRQK
ncbi:hypothetical protein FQA39_LY17329 [Lamprigera yunnana]|nr:hypothetical protein FQA39_LY17329 [Lamprigera yunnana]